MTLIERLEKAGEGSRFRVHPGQTSNRAKTTFWVRDRLDPKWPDGPYATREQAEAVRLKLEQPDV
jgi:hypothetical protein